MRSIPFKRKIIGNTFCCFTPGYSYAYSLRVYSNKNYNDPSGCLLGLYIKADLKAQDRHPTVSLTVPATSLFFGPCENPACLMAFTKATKSSCLWKRLNLSRKTSLLRMIYCRNLHQRPQARIRLDLVLSIFTLAWAVTEAPSRENSQSRWGPMIFKIEVQLGREKMSE